MSASANRALSIAAFPLYELLGLHISCHRHGPTHVYIFVEPTCVWPNVSVESALTCAWRGAAAGCDTAAGLPAAAGCALPRRARAPGRRARRRTLERQPPPRAARTTPQRCFCRSRVPASAAGAARRPRRRSKAAGWRPQHECRSCLGGPKRWPCRGGPRAAHSADRGPPHRPAGRGARAAAAARDRPSRMQPCLPPYGVCAQPARAWHAGRRGRGCARRVGWAAGRPERRPARASAARGHHADRAGRAAHGAAAGAVPANSPCHAEGFRVLIISWQGSGLTLGVALAPQCRVAGAGCGQVSAGN